jgi:hypothetical protein
VKDLILVHDGLVFLRHDLILSSLRDLLAKTTPFHSVQDAHTDLVSRLLSYTKNTIVEQAKPSFAVMDAGDSNLLLNKHPLLDFALRYWPIYLAKTPVFVSQGVDGAVKAFAKSFPTSVKSLLLQARLWEHRPKHLSLFYQSIVTDIYRRLPKDTSALALQSVIFLALLNQKVGRVDVAAGLFFEATTTSRELLGASHTVTMHMATSYIEVTESKVTTSRTDIMKRREEVLHILVDNHRAASGQSSTQVVVILRKLVHHYRHLGDEDGAKRIEKEIESITRKEPDGDDVPIFPIDGRPKEANVLDLELEETDEKLEVPATYDFVLELQKAEKEKSEFLFIKLWQWVSQEHQRNRSERLAEWTLRVLLSYSEFLRTKKRVNEAATILVSVWEEYSQYTSSILSETCASLLFEVARAMKSVGLSSVALSVSRSLGRR